MKNPTPQNENRNHPRFRDSVAMILILVLACCSTRGLTQSSTQKPPEVSGSGNRAEASRSPNPARKPKYEPTPFNLNLERSLNENIETVKILNRYAKISERKGKYYRRTRTGRLRSFTYDFQLGKFVCENDGRNILYEDPIDCNPPYEIHEMDAVRIKIRNINPFVYTVNLFELQGDRISNEHLTEGSTSHSLTIDFKTLTPLSVEKVGLSSTTDTTLMGQINEMELIKRTIADLKKQYSALEILVLPDTTKETKQSRIDSLAKITALIKVQDDELFKLDQKRNTQSLSFDKIKGKEIELQKCLAELQKNAMRINQFVDAYNSFLYFIHSPINDVETIKQYMNETLSFDGLVKSYNESSEEVLQRIGEAHLKIQELVELDAALVKKMESDKTKNYTTRASIYNIVQHKLDNFENDFKALDGNKLLSQLLYIRTMAEPEHFTVVYETHSIAENADYLKYNFEFKPRNISNAVAQAAARSNLELAFQIHEGAKFDISSGFVLDFGLTDPTYYFDRTTDASGTKVYVKEGENSSQVNPSLAVFLNGYKRTSTNFKLGGALGVGLSNNARFRLYAGPSLIVGRKERIVLSGGVSFGAVARLADGYSKGGALENNTSLPNEVPTVVDHYKVGAYVGVGFNLTGKENKSFMEKLKFN